MLRGDATATPRKSAVAACKRRAAASGQAAAHSLQQPTASWRETTASLDQRTAAMAQATAAVRQATAASRDAQAVAAAAAGAHLQATAQPLRALDGHRQLGRAHVLIPCQLRQHGRPEGDDALVSALSIHDGGSNHRGAAVEKSHV